MIPSATRPAAAPRAGPRPEPTAAGGSTWAARTFGLDTRSLAAFRIAVGAIVAADAVLRTRDLPLMFAPQGFFPLPLLRQWRGDPCWWSLATVADASWLGPAVLALEAVAGVLLAAGCLTRAATIAAWVAVVSVLRRTAPASNAGDAWLCCLLFWGAFLPLGAVWSVDAGRGREAARGGPRGAVVLGPPTAALVLQVAAVYLAAGLAKCNDGWLSGAAVAHALSVHDHGTPLGDRLFAGGWLSRPLSWAVVGGEIGVPLVLLGLPRLRGPLVAVCIGFHAACCGLLSIGLFGYVGMAAWLPLIPSAAWDCGWSRAAGTAGTAPRPPEPCGRSRGAALACTAAGIVAAASLAHDLGPAGDRPAPAVLRHLADLGCLHQEWRMFGTVERQEQWAYARAELADGRVVDLLRAGRPLEAERPAGGFATLPHHRWHKLMWNLPRPGYRVFAAPVAAALATDWDRRHAPIERVITVELHAARLGRTAADDTLHDILLASWPPRSSHGAGGLDRLLAPAATGETAR